MNNRIFKKAFNVILVAMLFALVFSVCSLARITAEDGVVKGLDPTKRYECASITIENYASPNYSLRISDASEYDGLSVGIWLIRVVGTTDVTTVWIEGDPDDRASIGTLVDANVGNNEFVKSADRQFTDKFVVGKWTHMNTAGNALAIRQLKGYDPYFFFVTNYHLNTQAYTVNYIDDIVNNREETVSIIENTVFKYGYKSEEILPITELESFSFASGFQMGSLAIDFKPGTYPKSKVVLYFINENGVVASDYYEMQTIYPTGFVTGQYPQARIAHTVDIKKAFPDYADVENLYVLGMEIYPYSSIPESAVLGKHSYGGLPTISGGMAYRETVFFVQFFPDEYKTVYENDSTLPTMYNGANTKYINGYGNNIFKPLNNITKAEVATILANIIAQGEAIPEGTTSKFADVKKTDWFFNAITNLESIGVFDYVKGNYLNPNEAITRGELSEMIARAAGYTGTTENFNDVDSSTLYYSAICALSEKGIINGYADGTFLPLNKITRAETVTIINRTLNLVTGTDYTKIDKTTLENTFTDVPAGAWYEDQVLMAANSNVTTATWRAAKHDSLKDSARTISFETNHIKITVNKNDGKVKEIINKATGENIALTTLTPWFVYVKDYSKVLYYPYSLEVAPDGRLHAKFTNGAEAYFIIETFDDYFTMQLDSSLPDGTFSVSFANLNTTLELVDDPNSYRISSLPMTTSAKSEYYMNAATATLATFFKDAGEDVGAKLGVAFTQYGDTVNEYHRDALKKITDAIDTDYGVASNYTGAYALDNPHKEKSYGLVLNGDIPLQATVEEISAQASAFAKLANRYMIDLVQLHHGDQTFIQGDFNFVGAQTDKERTYGDFITPEVYKERIVDKLNAEGVGASLHTFASLISPKAETLLTNPTYQKQIAYNENVFYLSEGINKVTSRVPVTETTNNITVPKDLIPYYAADTAYILVDQEIMQIRSVGGNTITVKRGQLGTERATHSAGAEVRQLQGWYSGFQPIPGTELFYQVARNLANAVNKGGFDMIYFDAYESIKYSRYVNDNNCHYYQGEFVREVLKNLERPTLICISTYEPALVGAQTRGGQTDYQFVDDKHYQATFHTEYILGYKSRMLTGNLGWHNFAPDAGAEYKNLTPETHFKDNLDQLGVMTIKYDLVMQFNPFAVDRYNIMPVYGANIDYYNVYMQLKKAKYFSQEVKDQLCTGEYEHQIFQQEDGSWAFKEVKYLYNYVFGNEDKTDTLNNPLAAQTPFIRIEQRYSSLMESEKMVFALDGMTPVTQVAGDHKLPVTNIQATQVLKVRVKGNNTETDAIRITLHDGEGARIYIIPLDFSGERDILLCEIDTHTNDFPQYDFVAARGGTFRPSALAEIKNIYIELAGDCEGVEMGSITAVAMSMSPVKNPSVTVGDKTLTFNTELKAGEYVEYYPQTDKAYYYYYDDKNIGHVKEIEFTGSIKIPTGTFALTYDAEALSDAPLRARVTVGAYGAVIANPEGFDAPEVNIVDNVGNFILY